MSGPTRETILAELGRAGEGGRMSEPEWTGNDGEDLTLAKTKIAQMRGANESMYRKWQDSQDTAALYADEIASLRALLGRWMDRVSRAALEGEDG